MEKPGRKSDKFSASMKVIHGQKERYLLSKIKQKI